MQAKYRQALPQMGDELFLTDGGQETTLIFHDGLELPHFAAFTLLRDATRGGRRSGATTRPTWRSPGATGRGLVLETPTWRSNPDWAARLGYDARGARCGERGGGGLRRGDPRRRGGAATPMVLSGAIGPRGDGYRPESLMSAAEAEAYHARQIGVFEAAGVDLVSAFTMTYVEEAIGIVRAAAAAGVPVGDLLHGRDRRLPALGDAARRGDRGLRRGDRRLCGLLHGELRASDALPRRAGRAAGSSGSAASGPTPRR